jgi:hypothetical protein
MDRLEEEHTVIQETIERVDRALVAFVGTPTAQRGCGKRSTC